ncbi:MAG: secretin N-terminal domain-containing protein [Candidatus Omnitrophota bacterium]
MKKKSSFFLSVFLFLLLSIPLFIPEKEILAGPSETTIIPILNNQEKISLDVKGMDIIDVLKILATRSGMNVVIGKNVTGRVTLFLKDVNISDAFQIIIAANDLAYDIKGDIVNIMTSRDYELTYGDKFGDKKEILNITLKYAKATVLSQALNQMKSSIGRVVVDEPTNTVIILDIPEKLKSIAELISELDRPLESKVFSLNYAQAEKINEKLQQSITKGIGSIRIDERTNKVAITDYPENIAKIEKIIAAFDEKTPQVLIDAQIVEVSPKKDEFSMGIDWNWWIRKNTRIISSLPAPALTSATAPIANSLAFGLAATDPDAAVDKQGQYKSVVEALRVIGQTKILSSPRIMVLNNQEAKILVGTKEAYITSTTSQGGTGTTVTSQAVNFVDVGIKLYVTPTINRDNFITIKIRPEISSSEQKEITSQDQHTQIPIVTTSESESTIMIKDGTTIMMAGLKKDKTIKETQRIPILGDIPYLGALFGNVKSESSKTELVIFITPHIITGEEPLEYNSNTEDKDINNIQKESFNRLKNDTFNNTIVQDYKTIIFNKIKTQFINLIKAGESVKGESTIAFTLNQNGNLKNEPYILSSNNKNLDEIAVTSIKKASPFPLLPNFEKDEETFRISLSYE